MVNLLNQGAGDYSGTIALNIGDVIDITMTNESNIFATLLSVAGQENSIQNGTLSSLTYSFIWNGTNNTNVLGIIVGSGE